MDLRDLRRQAQARLWADKLKAKCSARKRALAAAAEASKADDRREAP